MRPVVIVAALARNGIIGGDNRLLWRLPSDMKRFRALTMGTPLVMGRKTFQSIGKPLPGRETVVVTRDRAFAAPGVHVAHDLRAALALAEELAEGMGASHISVAGGGEIYAQAMPFADRMALTLVDLDVAGDTCFPAIPPDVWREAGRETPARAAGDEAGFSFVDYERF